MDLLKLGELFLKLTLAAAEVIPRFAMAKEIYEAKKNVKLMPGPAGTQGQVFFINGNSDIVVKITIDKSEAANMWLVHKIQNNDIPTGLDVDDLYTAGTKLNKLTQEDIAAIKSNIIAVYGVYKVTPSRGGLFYVIEQEKGEDLPVELSNRLMKHIGQQISKQPPAVFDSISEDLSKSENVTILSNILLEALVRDKQAEIDSADVTIGELGKALAAVRGKLDKYFKDFRPSNMLVTRSGGKYTVKLTDLGYATPRSLGIESI